MPDDDYYRLLGLSKSASDTEIRNAYRRLVKKHHPDRNKGDKDAETRFKQIQEAYEVLSDKEKRDQYDQFGKVGVGEFVDSGAKQYYKWGGDSTINVEDLEDLFSAFGDAGGGTRTRGQSIFEQFMGRGPGGPGRAGPGGVAGGSPFGRPTGGATRPKSVPTPGKDVERVVNISFEQAIAGATVDITLTKRSASNPKKERLSVKIPPDVADGQKIRLKGKGTPGRNGGPAGDMLIVCRVKDHPYFKRDGRDITITVPVGVTEAMLGAKIDVPTLQGATTITIPPGTKGGARLRLRGRGAENSNGQPAGDQYVIIQIVPPKSLTDLQKDLVQKLADSIKENPRESVPWAKEKT